MTVHQHTGEGNVQNCAPSITDYGCNSMRGDLLKKINEKLEYKNAIDEKYTLQTKGEH